MQPIAPQPVAPPQIPTQSVPEVTVFPTTSHFGNLDITNIVTQRLNAMRKLQDNPNDYEAQSLLNSAQRDVICLFENNCLFIKSIFYLNFLDECLGNLKIFTRTIYRKHWCTNTVSKRIVFRISVMGTESKSI